MKFEPRDLWIGLYWTPIMDGMAFYLCVLPCLPIVLSYDHGWEKEWADAS